MCRTSKLVTVGALVFACVLFGFGGGSGPGGVDILPYPCGCQVAPSYAATITPESLLYDYVALGDIPSDGWDFGDASGSWRLHITPGPAILDGCGNLHQPVLVSGTIKGHVVMSVGTLCDWDGLLALIGPDGTYGMMFVLDGDGFSYPLFYKIHVAFDPDELLDGDATDDVAGRGEDGNGSGGIPHGPVGLPPLYY